MLAFAIRICRQCLLMFSNKLAIHDSPYCDRERLYRQEWASCGKNRFSPSNDHAALPLAQPVGKPGSHCGEWLPAKSHTWNCDAR
jgi:hypothetical protein